MSNQQERVNRYAQALWQAQLEIWEKAFGEASKAVAQKKVAAVLTDSAISAADKGAALEKALPKDFPGDILNLLKVMVDAGDLNLLDAVAGRVANALQSAPANALKAEVTSAVELSADEKDKIRKRLIAENGEGLTFTFAVDPALMGGLRVRVGDRLVDNSVATRLATLRESIAAVVR